MAASAAASNWGARRDAFQRAARSFQRGLTKMIAIDDGWVRQGQHAFPRDGLSPRVVRTCLGQMKRAPRGSKRERR